MMLKMYTEPSRELICRSRFQKLEHRIVYLSYAFNAWPTAQVPSAIATRHHLYACPCFDTCSISTSPR